MINLLLTILVLAVIFGLVFWLLQQLPLPSPWAQIVQICAILICLFVLLGLVFGGISLPSHLRISYSPSLPAVAVPFQGPLRACLGIGGAFV